jgi:serine/tyrosine/threonine adenylyltransferase
MQFDNRFVRTLPADPVTDNRRRQVHGALYSRVAPTPVAAPRLIAHSREVAAMLGFTDEYVRSQRFADVFAGNTLEEGMEPFAANYGGHQFGNWAGQLGDGRAITLGELVAPDGHRHELQLKGAGPTPYARTADGRAVLRSSIREFLCSEAMHHLGVPTTRALCLVGTGEQVERDMFYDGRPQWEPGAVVCRVSPSFIRFGNFELPASRDDKPLLEKLVDFTIARDFPELAPLGAGARDEWFGQVCERTAVMVAHWMRVGFVHGVMNTDNMSILGLTIDYGPYGWVDNFDLDWTPNTTDAGGRRYRFGYQPHIAFWNLGRLASALAVVWPSHDPLHAGLARFESTFEAADRGHNAAKLGLAAFGKDDEALLEELHGLLQASEVDMTIFFRSLARLDLAVPSTETFADAFYDEGKRAAHEGAWSNWLASYAARVRRDGLDPQARRARMDAANPRYVLRNYMAQEAIDLAEKGDAARIDELLELLRRPYDEQPGREAFAKRRPDWARNRAGCSMLSCSS